MSRPRLDAEQKKIGFSLAFSPNLIAALENVRGVKSQSVFVEEWLRQHPLIAAELSRMNDPGFAPPVARYAHLIELLLAFYSPGSGEQSTLQNILMIAQKIIIRYHERPGQEIEEQIRVEMSAFWLQERRKHGSRTVRGDNLEDVLPAILEYARYYYEVIFLDMAQGERKLLQHRFRSLVRGCEAVYREKGKSSDITIG
ncbi:MAG: hypothetical protein ABI456_11930 [Ktedonobacteraceae bacterium]|nr:hypothetical protein [Chloroflexota bacterium]